MAYVVLARKYRPQTFEEVIGQEAAARTLQNAIRADRVAHAFLFSGPRGVGKTSLARILAKALNCEAGMTPDPCGTCPSCCAVTAGRDLDVIEIDGASNNGVENIRELRENSDTVAVRSRYKIYIIDEVHMLSKGAFNALLKTLEEPPAHVKFIFATTEPEKVPDTIHSRCQRYELREISPADITRRLEQICTAEQIHTDDGVLDLIAHSVRGGMRDAQSALDQLRSFCSDQIDLAAAVQVLGVAGHEALYRLTDAVARADVPAAFEQVGAILAGRRAAAEVAAQWVDFLREVLVGITCGEAGNRLLRPGTATPDEVGKLASRLSAEFVVYAIQVIDQSRVRMLHSMQASVLLEIAVVKLCRTDAFKPLAEIAQLAAGASSTGGAPARSSRRPAAPPAPAPPDAGLIARQDTAEPAAPVPRVGDADFWTRLHDEVEKSAGPMLASYLREARLVSLTGTEVIACMEAAFHRSELESRDNRHKIETCIEAILGSRRVFTIVNGAGANKDAPPREKKKAAIPEPVVQEAPRNVVSETSTDKSAQEAMRLFDGRVVSVEPSEPREAKEE